MKKVLCKSLSTIMALFMLFASIPMLVSAEEPVVAPEFTVEKVSETTTTLELVLKLKSGSFMCFDAYLTVNGLSCETIITTDEFDAFLKSVKVGGGQNADCENPENGKMSVSVTESCTAPMDIAVYTFKKTSAAGINGSDVNFAFDSCYVASSTDEEIEVTESVKSEIALPEKHQHVTGDEWAVVSDATCSEEGLEVLICSECGAVADSRSIKKTEHANTVNEHKDATCTEAGYDKVYCKDCETYIKNDVLPATNHAKTHEEKKAATCTEAGYYKLICDDCKKVLKEETYPATNHAKTHEEKKAATCEEAGYYKLICDDCKKVLKEETYPAKGHGATHTETVQPTCTVDGAVKTVCNDCGKTISSTPIPAQGHPSLKVEKKAATCTEDGYIRYCCEKCGDVTKENVLKATGHTKFTEVTPATCHEEGKEVDLCTVCHHVFATRTLPKTSHKWGKWITEKEATSTSEGLSRRQCEICFDTQEKAIPILKENVKEIVMSMDALTMNFKKTTRLYANVLPEAAAYSNEVVWTSSNTKVATVDGDGNVTAKGVGTATITASTVDGRIKDSCTVTVKYSWIQIIIVYVLFGWIWYV